MKKNPKCEIQKVAKFLNVELSEERLEVITKETSLKLWRKILVRITSIGINMDYVTQKNRSLWEKVHENS